MSLWIRLVESKRIDIGEVFMDKNELERIWYRGLFSSAEINHIFNPTAPIDVLMKERADIILDNTRLYRLYLHKRNICEIKNIPWNFMQTFSCNHYNFFINNLPSPEMEFCSKIAYGDMYAKKSMLMLILQKIGEILFVLIKG